jgi:DNA-binding LacI/PurR family transcriptional regulator
MTTEIRKLGRRAEIAASALREEILTGKIRVGTLLPSVRVLARRYEIDTKTQWRALKGLERERLVIAEPARGFRVLPSAHDPHAGNPVALLADTSLPNPLEGGGTLLSVFSKAAAERGLSLIAFPDERGKRMRFIEQLRSIQSFGVVTDCLDRATVADLHTAGFPVVLFDMSNEMTNVDSVMQDGYNGALLAARHIIGKGCRRITWFGDDAKTPHALERFAGTAAGLFEADLELDANSRVVANPRNCVEKAKELLSSPRRPEAVIALWSYLAIAIKRAADSLGLVIGRDFQLVGWTVAEDYATHFKPSFDAGAVPAAVCWSARSMADIALARLIERRIGGMLEPITMRIGTKLVLDPESP